MESNPLVDKIRDEIPIKKFVLESLLYMVPLVLFSLKKSKMGKMINSRLILVNL